jgi:hypothetical protein
VTRPTKLVLAALPGLWLAAPAGGAPHSLAMLDQLERGSWELRLRSGGQGVERICLGDVSRLIQLRHPGPSCERIVVAAGANAVTVQYTCQGRGYGRTEIRRETNRLVQVQSQGIVDGLPYEVAAEARRVGDCTV